MNSDLAFDLQDIAKSEDPSNLEDLGQEAVSEAPSLSTRLPGDRP